MVVSQQLRWREPWFFSLRMRDRRGWRRKGWLIIAIFIAMLLGLYLDQRYGKGLRIGLPGGALLSLGIAVFVSFLPDLTLTEVQATDAGVARASYGHAIGASLWRYQDILQFGFIPRERSGKPFGLLILDLRANPVILGVPDSVSRDQLVEFFRSRGVQEARTFDQAPQAKAGTPATPGS